MLPCCGKLLLTSAGTNPNPQERGETKVAGIGMGQMWGPAVIGSKGAGLGMLSQEIGQGEKKGVNPHYFSPE